MYKIKNTPNEINGGIDTAEEKVSKLANIIIRTIQNEIHRKNTF